VDLQRVAIGSGRAAGDCFSAG
jgi:hypothetical protein